MLFLSQTYIFMNIGVSALYHTVWNGSPIFINGTEPLYTVKLTSYIHRKRGPSLNRNHLPLDPVNTQCGYLPDSYCCFQVVISLQEKHIFPRPVKTAENQFRNSYFTNISIFPLVSLAHRLHQREIIKN
jgi:hypothetical protein